MIPKLFPFTSLFDSHAHLSTIKANTDELIQKSLQAGVSKIVDVANDIYSTSKTLQLHKTHPDIILATAGIHPELAIPGSDMFQEGLNNSIIEEQVHQLDELIQSNLSDFSIIGETGLDYYWLEKSDLPKIEIEKNKNLQKILFSAQLRLAKKYNLPLTIHARSSHQDCLKIIKGFTGLTGVFHSFVGNLVQAREILGLGFALGINGIITYKSAQELRDTIISLTKDKKINTPADLYACGIYLETDSPFLIPSNINERPEFNSPQQISTLWDFIYNLLSHK